LAFGFFAKDSKPDRNKKQAQEWSEPVSVFNYDFIL